ncbi:MAG: hypothetical protein RLY29_216 [Actinomycetota bacterium]
MVLIKAITAGLALWAGFAPLELWPAPFLGLLLLFQNLKDASRAKRVLLAFLTGISFFAPLLHWSGSYVGALPWLLLTFLQATLFSLIGIFRFTPWTFAASFVTLEILRMKAPFGGFGWGRIGFTQVEPLSHIYPIIGVTGVSFLVALISALLVGINLRQSFGFSLFLLIPLMTNNISYASTIKISAVQGGVDQLGLDFSSRAMSVFNRHLEQTKSVSSESKLVIWPENAADIDPERNVVAQKALQALLSDVGKPILVGAVSQGSEGPANVSILYGADGQIRSRYQKQDLAPFGEYMPLRVIAEQVAPEAKRVRDFQPGMNWTIHDIEGARFASVICFEVLDDDLIRMASHESDFLVAQTNNATFGRSPQAGQQLQITRARAAELGKDIAVVSTTGFTAKIGADGAIERRLPQFEPGVLEMEIGLRSAKTIASGFTSWSWLAVFGLLALWSRRSVFTR